MSKNKIISILILCATVLSILAGVMIYHYMAPNRAYIMVFNDDYKAGTLLNINMVTSLEIDARIMNGGKDTTVDTAFVTPTEFSTIQSQAGSLRMDVGEGMPLTRAMLDVTGGSKLQLNMNSEKIAVTIPINSITGVTNDLKDGSMVNIYVTRDGYTQLLQQKAKVLEVFRSDNGLSGVAIEENVAGSMALIDAEQNGSIYLGLINENGYTKAKGDDLIYVNPNTKTTNEQSQYSGNTNDPLQYTDTAHAEETETDMSKINDDSGVFGNE